MIRTRRKLLISTQVQMQPVKWRTRLKEAFQAIWRKKHKKEDHPDRRNVDACAVPPMIVAKQVG